MNFSAIIITVLILIVLLIVIYTVVKPSIDRLLTIKNKEAENEKARIFIDISPEAVEKELDAYFERYVRRYIVYKFVSSNTLYIKDEDCIKMVKEITENIAIEISDLYCFYLKIISSITSDDDLILAINKRVKNKVIEEVTNYNKSIEL